MKKLKKYELNNDDYTRYDLFAQFCLFEDTGWKGEKYYIIAENLGNEFKAKYVMYGNDLKIIKRSFNYNPNVYEAINNMMFESSDISTLLDELEIISSAYLFNMM